QVPIQHVAMNVAKFVRLRHDQELYADVLGADIVGVDGMGILLGARLLGIPVPARVAGVDLMTNVLDLCAQRGYRPYLLGAHTEVLERAVKNVVRSNPQLQLAGYHHGYFSAAEEAVVVESIRAARPDCLFVGLPTPQKERFMAAHRQALGVPFVMGVGGGLDVLAGVVSRAPAAWQNAGFEWLYRTIQEPRRMWRRYLYTNAAYAGILAQALFRRAVAYHN
ncbi:MAG: WecB/TagA/CpsF family glycosyltransferase, partial [Acetobacteraceae bacterium]